MTTFERRQQLIGLLHKQAGLRVPELAKILGVSQGTIRNDLNALHKEGQLNRVRGGAVLSDELPLRSVSFTTRLKKNAATKQSIARWAADFVEDGDSIFLDASSTVYYLVHFLQNRRKLRVITNGIEIARAMAQIPTATVVLLGGVVNPDGSSISGSMSELFLQDLHVQTAFMGCSGFTPDAGLTEVHFYEAQLKSKAINTAERVIALVDSSKIGKVDLTPFAQTNQITHLFTDHNLSQAWIARLQQTNLTFSVCDENGVSSFTPTLPENKHYRIGFANQDERLPFAIDVRKSLERASEKAGNVDLVLADNQLDPDVALKVAERFLTQNLDLIIEYQIDEHAGNRIMNMFQNADIPVISVDIPMIGATYFGVDNYRAGQMAGIAMGEWVRLNWNGFFDRLIILEEPRAGALPATRMQGQLDGFQTVVGVVPAENRLVLNSHNTLEVSQAQMQASLRRLPNEHRLVVMCFNDDVALGALEAARSLGREQDLVIVGQGAERLVRLEMSRLGSRIIGSTAYLPEKYGEKLIALALKILRGESTPPAVYMEHTFITAEPEAENV
ncbi:MAG TPA: substrate-binding domain-containing protein [Anaerolineaceae bacterium]|nr:substrate-binding domain-containing protein [Anaerolineaceae bacterium]